MRTLVGLVSLFFYSLNTVFWCLPIFALSFFKLIPIKTVRRLITHALEFCATSWVTLNNLNQSISMPTKWQVSGLDSLVPDDWYLIISNHQSWVDILVLQRIFNKKIPFLKFFLKQQLIWVPLLGLAWWALDFPFMQRYSREFLKKNPHLKGKDLETTRKACEKFSDKPTSIMNFVEGTRFTPKKHNRQSSPYEFLLNPRAGGVAFVLNAMGDQIHKLIDVTIHYPSGIPSFWHFVCGAVPEIAIQVKVQELDDLNKLDYFADDKQKAEFQQWLNNHWHNKDEYLQTLQVRHQVTQNS